MLWKNRLVSFVALLALGLGIGANSAIFSVINSLLLRPLPYDKPEGIVMVWESRPQQGVTENVVSAADFKDWREQNQVFQHLAAFQGDTFGLGDVEMATQIYGARVSSNFFTLLGIRPALGRTFNAEEETPGKEHVVLMSHGLWRNRFGADPRIIDRPIRLNDETYTVIGVLPPEFEFQDRDLQLWSPLVMTDKELSNRGLHYLTVVGRLKPGVTLEQARADMGGIAGRLAQAYPDKNEGHGVNLVSLHDQLGKTVKTALLMLLAVVLCVLLIACANVANLLLSLTVDRRKESAIRTALGASRMRIFRQFLTESLVLSILGGVIGLLFAFWGVKLITTLIPEVTSVTIYGWDKISVDGRVIGFTLAVAVLTGIVFGTAPALRASDFKLTEELKEGTKGSSGGSRSFLRNLLVVTEIALALTLLTGAGLMLKSFWRLQDVDPGFDPRNLLTMELPISTARYPTPAQQIAALQQITRRVEGLHGVEAVGAVFSLPLGGQRASRTFTVDGQAPQSSSQDARASYNAISPNHLRAMGIPLLKGRDFTEADLAAPPGAIIVNATLANRVWPGEDPLGRRIKIGGPQSTNPWLSVIGVAADARQASLNSDVRPEIYVPLTQSPVPNLYLTVRVTSDAATLAPEVRRAIQEVDGNQPVGNIRTMEEVLSESVAQPRLYAVLLGCFAALALLLSVVGIYSMMAYSVTQRTQEIGIRMALGAAPRDILRLILGQALLLTLIGGVIGLFGAFAATRLVSSLLFGISAQDPLTFVQVSLILLVVALAASYIPARRATRVEPLRALRHE
jgi:putative ABC transport system permease protein